MRLILNLVLVFPGPNREARVYVFLFTSHSKRPL